MEHAATKIPHPHIEHREGVCGGRPVLAGTRFPVRSVVAYVLRQGMTPEELVAEFPHLTLASVHDALSYYYDHREEIDGDAWTNSEENQQRTAD